MDVHKSNTTNEAYLEGIRLGNPSVLHEIKQRFFPSVAKFVLSNSGKEGDPQEVFSDAIVVLFRKVQKGGFEITKSTFFTYFFAVCKNIWLKKLAQRSKMQVTFPGDDALIDKSVTDSIEITEQYALYREKFAELGEDCQKLLQLFYYIMKILKKF